MRKIKSDPRHEKVESLLKLANWSIQDHTKAALKESLGVAVRDYPLARDYGKIDYLLFLEGKAVGLIELQNTTQTENTPPKLLGLATDAPKYSRGLPFTLRLFTRPLPFLYQSHGSANSFTNIFDPHPKPRHLIGFHRPETLRGWLEDGMVGETPRDMAAEHFPEHRRRGRSFQERIMINMPKLSTEGLSPEQHKSISNTERSLSENRMSALIESRSTKERAVPMIRMIERLLKFADARRVLVLVHTEKAAQKLEADLKTQIPSIDGLPFTEAFPLQHLKKSIASDSRLCIAKLSDLHNLLGNQETSKKETSLRYNSAFPIETFEVVILESCDVSLTKRVQTTLRYFDAYLIGFTQKVSQETADFFDQNLVMRYKKPEPSALSEGLNVIASDFSSCNGRS